MNKNMILTILQKAKFTEQFIQYVERHFPNDYQVMEETPYVRDYLKNPLLSLDAHERMMETIAQLIKLQKMYDEKSIPLSHLYNSIYDLSYRIERYYSQHGIYGLSERDVRWLTPIFQLDIFDIGVLRFQLSNFSYQEIERSGHEYMALSSEWKQAIPEGSPIITIHIMKNAKITPEKVTASFKQAVHFFEQYFPIHDYELFVCRTWLLYEPIQKLLGEKSNITDFAKRLTIIARNNNSKQALERIYGTSNIEDIKAMEKTSSLQKKVYNNLDLVGEAAGIIRKSSIN